MDYWARSFGPEGRGIELGYSIRLFETIERRVFFSAKAKAVDGFESAQKRV
jgi:hypothetical protein